MSEPSKRRVSASRGQQVVPEGAAAEDQDLPARLALELGDRGVGVGPVDDPGGGPPRAGLVLGEAVGDDHLVDGVVQPGELAVDGLGVAIGAARSASPQAFQ